MRVRQRAGVQVLKEVAVRAAEAAPSSPGPAALLCYFVTRRDVRWTTALPEQRHRANQPPRSLE